MIFVTGGTGLLGSHLLCRLLNDPSGSREPIVALKRPSSSVALFQRVLQYEIPEPEKRGKSLQWVDGDLTDCASYEKFITPQTRVYHAAALVSFQKKDRERLRQVNVEGTAALVNTCLEKGALKLCYASSIAALGRGNGITTEDDYRTSVKGSSAYSASKYEAEMEVWRGIAEGLDAVMVNPSVILGPGDRNRGSSELFGTVARGLKFFTRGVNGYVDVRDVARAMVMLMESDISGERFILSAANLSYEELFRQIAAALKVPPPPFYAPPWMGQIAWRLLAAVSFFTGKTPLITKETAKNAAGKFYYSSEKIIEKTGFRFTPIQETIAFTAARFRTFDGQTK